MGWDFPYISYIARYTTCKIWNKPLLLSVSLYLIPYIGPYILHIIKFINFVWRCYDEMVCILITAAMAAGLYGQNHVILRLVVKTTFYQCP